MTADSPYGLEMLAIGAHPDDVELCCGGLLLRMAVRGYATGVLDLTRGEMSSHGTVGGRAAEAETAARLLGLAHRENLGLPDAGLFPWSGAGRPDEERAASQVARVVEALRRLRPEIVVVPYEHERHPDHEAASALITRALFFAGVRKFATEPNGEPYCPRQVLYYPMRVQVEPTFVVDITQVAQRKVEAIRSYASQLERSSGAHPTLINSPQTLSVFEARDRYYGGMIGVPLGEPYVTRTMMAVGDPVEHFRRNGFAPPLLFPAHR